MPRPKDDDRGVKFTRGAAREIAETVRAVRSGGNRNQPPVKLPRFGGGGGVVLARYTAPWSKGSVKAVADARDTTITYDAKNYFASLGGTGSKYCAITFVVDEWILIAAEC